MEKRSSEITQQVVRSLVVSLAPPNEIYHSYYEQKNTPSILRYYIGIKGEGADRRYTLLGGKLKDSENWREGIQREVSEEAGLRFFGIPNQTNIGSWKYSSEKSGNREIMLTYNPVLACDQITIGDPKISSVTTLSLEEFRKLIIEGQLNGMPIEGHLALGESGKDSVNISPEDVNKKNSSLLKALSWGGAY
jgi:hypothetical protein